MQMTTCTRQTFLSKTFAKSLNIQKQYQKIVWEKSNDAYSLSKMLFVRLKYGDKFSLSSFWKPFLVRVRGGGVLAYMGYIAIGIKGYGFSAVLVINRVSI